MIKRLEGMGKKEVQAIWFEWAEGNIDKQMIVIDDITAMNHYKGKPLQKDLSIGIYILEEPKTVILFKNGIQRTFDDEVYDIIMKETNIEWKN